MTEYGLVLDLGGATDEDYKVGREGFPPYGEIGWFNKNHTTPLSECGISLEDAKRYDKDPGCPLKLVKYTSTNKPAVDTATKENN